MIFIKWHPNLGIVAVCANNGVQFYNNQLSLLEITFEFDQGCTKIQFDKITEFVLIIFIFITIII
jgi:hypothetical protein